MPTEYKPKINKGLKVEYKNNVYDKIISLDVYNNEVHLSNKESEYVTNNIHCKLSEIKITLE